MLKLPSRVASLQAYDIYILINTQDASILGVLFLAHYQYLTTEAQVWVGKQCFVLGVTTRGEFGGKDHGNQVRKAICTLFSSTSSVFCLFKSSISSVLFFKSDCKSDTNCCNGKAEEA